MLLHSSLQSFYLPRNIQVLAGMSFHANVSLPALSPCVLRSTLYLDFVLLYRGQSCLLTPFKGVNAETIEFYAITFDVVYTSLILSSPLFTLGIR